jgi:cytochrome c oxidase cbb3-type subunit 3
VWDGDLLREVNNPLPRWWSWLFIITVILRWPTLPRYPVWATMCRQVWLERHRRYGLEVAKGNDQASVPVNSMAKTWQAIPRPWRLASACS